jgi:hypothetical protein
MRIVQISRIQTLRNSVRAEVGPRTLFLILSYGQKKRFGLGKSRDACKTRLLNWHRPNRSKHLPHIEKFVSAFTQVPLPCPKSSINPTESSEKPLYDLYLRFVGLETWKSRICLPPLLSQFYSPESISLNSSRKLKLDVLVGFRVTINFIASWVDE